jgi:hypothetical protein
LFHRPAASGISANLEKRRGSIMSQDYDESRPDVAEASERTLKAVRQMDAPDAKRVQAELEEADLSEGTEPPGAIVLDELVVEVVDGVMICRDCAEL